MKRALALGSLMALGALVASLWGPLEMDGPPAPPDSNSPSPPVARTPAPVHAAVAMHDPDCTSAPCILGFDYDAASVAAADGGARGFQQAVRAAFEAELGYPVTSMQVEDAEAGPRIRMFAVPQEVERSDPLRNRLIENAHRRQAGPGAN